MVRVKLGDHLFEVPIEYIYHGLNGKGLSRYECNKETIISEDEIILSNFPDYVRPFPPSLRRKYRPNPNMSYMGSGNWIDRDNVRVLPAFRNIRIIRRDNAQSSDKGPTVLSRLINWSDEVKCAFDVCVLGRDKNIHPNDKRSPQRALLRDVAVNPEVYTEPDGGTFTVAHRQARRAFFELDHYITAQQADYLNKIWLMHPEEWKKYPDFYPGGDNFVSYSLGEDLEIAYIFNDRELSVKDIVPLDRHVMSIIRSLEIK